MAEVAAYLAQNEIPAMVIFVCFDEANRDAYNAALGRGN